MANNLDKVIASIKDEIPKKVYNSIAKSSPTMAMLMRKKKVWDSGGDTIKPHIKYKEAENTGSYRGYDTMDITPQNTRTDAEFRLKQYYASVVFNGYEKAISSGDNAVFNLVDIAMKDAEDALKDKFATDLFGDGTGNGGKALLGLNAAIDDGTSVATYGGIPRSTYTWWKAQYDGAAAALTIAKMRNLFMLCVRGGVENRPDFIVTDLNQWNAYAELIDGKTNIQQIPNKTAQMFADFGFPTLHFMGIPVVYDEYCPADKMYFINSETVQLWTKPGLDFKMTELVKPANMDAKIGQILWGGELICTEPRANGKMENLT